MQPRVFPNLFLKPLFAVAVLCTSLTALAGGAAESSAGNPVTRWNAVAIQVLPVDPGLVVDSRAFAIVHAAIHDAVNGVERRYEPYTIELSSPNASVDAAIATAARDTLVALSPSQSTTVEIAYAATLLGIPDGAAKQAGIELGHRSAEANLARRLGDGADSAGGPPYVPKGEPGDYDFTPPFDKAPFGPVALFPGWGSVTPFGVEMLDHRLPGPQALTSREYTRDFKLLKAIGRHDSSLRSAEQTDIAMFWFEFSPMGWNRIANTILVQENADVWRSARIMALVNFALADGYIAGFEAKYHFRFWRPYTAIRKGDSDGNDATRADPNWMSLQAPAFFIPPVPDYPSTHTVLGAAAAEVLIRNFGDRVSFTVVSTTLPGATRQFNSITAAAWENGMSRIYGGIHFRRAVRDGFQQGQGIGRQVSHMLPRVGDPD
jgi:membrane-associated phospholipid phosphatase